MVTFSSLQRAESQPLGREIAEPSFSDLLCSIEQFSAEKTESVALIRYTTSATEFLYMFVEGFAYPMSYFQCEFE
jgi:hypothetical protein